MPEMALIPLIPPPTFWRGRYRRFAAADEVAPAVATDTPDGRVTPEGRETPDGKVTVTWPRAVANNAAKAAAAVVNCILEDGLLYEIKLSVRKRVFSFEDCRVLDLAVV